MFKKYLSLIESENKKLFALCSKNQAKIFMKHPEKCIHFSDKPDFPQEKIDNFIEETGFEPVILEFAKHENKIKFDRVWKGVVEDALVKNLDKENLDEVARYGLQRCTSVTCNALFKHFGKPGITLNDVPETDIGVLELLSKGGLSYKPNLLAVGKTVQQFTNLNQRGCWYLVTPGHAMALIDGELFDAENRGPDGRKIIQAYMILRR